MSSLTQFGVTGFDDEFSLDALGVEAGQFSLLELMNEAQRKIDPELQAFRSTRISGKTYLQWAAPGDNEKDGIFEVSRDIVAVRGVIVRAGFGFMLYDSENSAPLCTTTKLVSDREGAVPLESSYPMPVPKYNPLAYKQKDSTAPDTPDKDVIRWGVQGSRGKSCADCVFAGEHIKTWVNGKGEQQTDRCGGTTQLLFYVTAFAFAKPNAQKKRIEAQWVDVVDYRDEDGQQVFAAPFIISLGISTRPVFARYSKGNPKLKTEPMHPTPVDVMSLNDYLTYLNRGGFIKPLKANRLAYRAVTELYMGQADDPAVPPTLKSFAAFRHVTDPAVVGGSADRWVHCALREYDAQMAPYGVQPLLPPIPAAAALPVFEQGGRPGPLPAVDTVPDAKVDLMGSITTR